MIGVIVGNGQLLPDPALRRWWLAVAGTFAASMYETTISGTSGRVTLVELLARDLYALVKDFRHHDYDVNDGVTALGWYRQNTKKTNTMKASGTGQPVANGTRSILYTHPKNHGGDHHLSLPTNVDRNTEREATKKNKKRKNEEHHSWRRARQKQNTQDGTNDGHQRN
jgi:hypothetical protein